MPKAIDNQVVTPQPPGPGDLPRLCGRYQLRRQIGAGASSLVFEAWDELQGVERAVKLARAPRAMALVEGEFAILSRLDHPGLVRAHDLGRLEVEALLLGQQVPAGSPFLVLDLVRGPSAAELLARSPLQDRGAVLLRVAAEVAESLSQLHRAGLVHRDIKPENLVADESDRIVLLDLGLAGGVESDPTGLVRGTLRYLAPETLVGEVGPRTDLYALGATLFQLADGQPPFSGDGADLVRQILDEPAPPLKCQWIDDSLARLIPRLLHKDPLRRPQSSHLLWCELERARGQPGDAARQVAPAPLLPPAFVGRAAELQRLTDLLLGNQGYGAAIVAGDVGIGKTALIREAERRYLLQAAAGKAPPLAFQHGGLAALVPRQQGSIDSLVGRVVATAVERAAQHPLALHLVHDHDSADSLLERVVPALVGTLRRRGDLPLRLMVESRDPQTVQRWTSPLDLEWIQLDLNPLEPADLARLARSMTGTDPPAERLRQLHSQSAGVPALAVELMRLGWGEAKAAALAEADLPSSAFDALVARRRRGMGGDARALLDALAIWDRPIGSEELARLTDGSARTLEGQLLPLISRGEVAARDEGICLPSRGYSAAWRRAMEPMTRAALRTRAAASSLADPIRRIEHLVEALADEPNRSLRLETVVKAARQLAAENQLPRALRLLERVQQQAPRPGAGRALLDQLLAQLYIDAGRYSAALSLLERPRSARERLLRAEALQRHGDYTQAERLLTELTGHRTPLVAERARVLLGRLLLRLSRPADALACCGLPPRLERALEAEGPLDPSAVEKNDLGTLEVAGLARLYLGRLEQADRLFACGCELLRDDGPKAQSARFESLRGMAAFRRGELELAAKHYQRAAERARAAADLHGLATYVGNLGSAEVELGRWAAALTNLSEAETVLESLGRTSELAAATCNLASLTVLLGDLNQAEKLRDRAAEMAQRVGSKLVDGYAQLCGAEIRRREGNPLQALERYAGARTAFEAAEARWETALCDLGEVEALLDADRTDEAQARMAASELSLATRAGDDALHLGRVLATRARLLLRVDARREQTEDVIAALARHAALLEARGALAELWRVATLLASLLTRGGHRRAAERALRRARQAWEQVMGKAPESYREQMKHDPDAKTLLAQWERVIERAEEPAAAPTVVVGAPSAPADWRLRRLLTLNKRLNSELRLGPLLDLVLDAGIELTDAERGFLILVEGESLEIKVARNIDRRSLEANERSVSRSIAQRAARSAEPVVTVDAATDDRFSEALSVSDLHLRSVLAVPLRVKGRVVGTLYVDHRLRRGAFGERDIELLMDLADQAAIAIDNARLLADNEQRRSRIEQLNRLLEQRLQSQASELDGVKEELRSSRQLLQLRHDYSNLIGRSAPMLQLFRLLDRVTDTELPVVICGESGTGKELVARAIHHNGSRSAKPFVGENCGAIPESLLESVLFGAMRGAFTGADRDRKGLFEIANGGTLLLDEVGEMSAAMQTKLLRVLQDGEFRRVGGEKTITADVRVIAASNKDLAQLVEDGRFREDLFYRLNVIRVDLPPLRERRDDIPLLVQHFLDKHAPERRVRLSKAALARLFDHPWRGNVRELENEVMRLVAMASDNVGSEDLSPQIGERPENTAPSGPETQGLALKPQVEQLERSLIHRALERTAGNQSRAAKLLGLSRYGLLKKLKRFFPEQYGGPVSGGDRGAE